MTATVVWRKSHWTLIKPIRFLLPGISLIPTIIFAIIVATAKGYQHSDEYALQQNYNYQPESYSNNAYRPPPQRELYTAVTYQELNASYHCGVIPDTNFELYRSPNPYDVPDVTPFGKFPWIVLILRYNKVVCQGTLVHHNFILTSAKCIPEYKSLADYEIRVGDWDILTDYNEYEAYTDSELRVCSRHPLAHCGVERGYYSGKGSFHNYQLVQNNYYQDDSSDLILIKANFEPSDKFPHVKPICLPKLYSAPKYYGRDGQDYYSSTSVCWVAGWYGSEITRLRNHPQSEEVREDRYYSNYKQRYSKNRINYIGYEASMIQKRAKVKQVDCPSSYENNYGHSSSSICFIGVDGYDACVAEQGAAVFCVVQEDQSYGEYNSGYSNQDASSLRRTYEPVDATYEIPVMSSLHPEYDHEKAKSYYSAPQIKAAPAPSKPSRYRAVLYAVIQKPALCRKGYDSYGNVYSRKSRPLVATRVDHETVSEIVDQFWTHGYDQSCPVTITNYKAPMRSYYQPKKSYKYSYYFGSYNRTPMGSYGYHSRRPMLFRSYYY